MKIRADFVTNSSSVSFLLTMRQEIADLMLRNWGDSGYSQLMGFLKKQIETKGSRSNINGIELYSMPIKFRNDGDAADLSNFRKGNSFYSANFKQLSEEELWSIIYGIILEGYLTEMQGFGATMIETY